MISNNNYSNVFQKIALEFNGNQGLKDSCLKSVFFMILAELNHADRKNLLMTNKVFKFIKFFPEFVNLKDPDILKKYLAEAYQGKVHLSHAVKIAARIYEANIRSIGGTSKYGLAFAVDSEIMAYAMQRAKDKTVLEIAGASGENGILFSFAGAKKVFVNDIEPSELKTFLDLKRTLPSDIQEKLEAIGGNCMDLLKNKPTLKGRVDLILCRNLIHFFSDQEQIKFFEIIKTILKPGGQAIFTANSKYSYGPDAKSLIENSSSTSFTLTQCLVTDLNVKSLPLDVIFHELAPIKGKVEDGAYLNFKSLYLYERTQATSFKWQVNNDQFQLLDERVRPKIKLAFEKNKDSIRKIQKGTVRVLINTSRMYSQENLSTLFKQNGFGVESTFVVSRQGHLVKDSDLFEKGQQVGAVIKY